MYCKEIKRRFSPFSTVSHKIRTGFVDENVGITTDEREPGKYHYINRRDGFVIQERFIRFYDMVLKMEKMIIKGGIEFCTLIL